MKTLFVLASVMAVLFLAAPNKIEAQRRKSIKSKEAYVLNESRAKALVIDYIGSHRGTSVMASTPDFAKELNEEALIDYMTDEPEQLTVATAFLRDLARARLLNVNSRQVSIINIGGEYEEQPYNGPCSPYRIKINHEPQSPLVSGSATWVQKLYRDCDWPMRGSVSGVVDESGIIGLELPTALASEYYYFTLVNDTLQPKGKGVWHGLESLSLRRTTGERSPLKITKYKYSLTDEAKALGLSVSGGNVKIGEMTIDSVSDLLLQGETNAAGRAKYSIKYNKLSAVLSGPAESGTFPVYFGQTPEHKWVMVR
jgi:hypothetical protein